MLLVAGIRLLVSGIRFATAHTYVDTNEVTFIYIRRENYPVHVTYMHTFPTQAAPSLQVSRVLFQTMDQLTLPWLARTAMVMRSVALTQWHVSICLMVRPVRHLENSTLWQSTTHRMIMELCTSVMRPTLIWVNLSALWLTTRGALRARCTTAIGNFSLKKC
jgi:hypothetical protein